MSEQMNNHNFMKANVTILKKATTKSNKCSHSDYASSQAGNFRRHLKMHTGEKSNKCSQCDFASCFASTLKTHMITHSGENSKKCNQYGPK